MATVINTGLTTSALKGSFFSAMQAVHPVWRELATAVKSTGPAESYRWLGTVPQMRPWGTGRLAKGLRSESYNVENQKYEATIEVDRDELADDQLHQIQMRVKELARRAATHPDKLLADLLDNGADAAYKCYDGCSFFSNSHPAGEGTQSNALTYDAANVAAPTADEFAAAYKAASTALLALKDDQGEPMSGEVGSLIVLVPANLWYLAREVLSSQIRSSTSNPLVGEAQVITFPRLSNTDRWYLLRNDVEVKSFIFQDREPLEFTHLADGSEESFKREKYLYGVRARYALAYGYWQYCIRTLFI
jgi:phage major head subunit gpT-like protein